ncbi:hypothetical protein [Umezawaea sp. NPDC059074]|uniref:hypothetical protein n=1 Tax=Umezawaea sp. NPDC059074 TaxID=3346716 RepID=UPI003683698F
MSTPRRTATLLTTAALCLLAVTACGPSATTGSPAPATKAPATAGSSPAEAANVPDTGCPLGVSDLSTATGLTFELGDTRQDHELETLPGVKANVCVYTSSTKPQDAGDPLVLRVDTVTGANAGTVKANFERSCTDNGGTLGESTVTNTRTCARGGNVIEGSINRTDRTVEVYFVNATTETAAALTEVFDKVLASVS